MYVAEESALYSWLTGVFLLGLVGKFIQQLLLSSFGAVHNVRFLFCFVVTETDS